jgi:hypothetical protein
VEVSACDHQGLTSLDFLGQLVHLAMWVLCQWRGSRNILEKIASREFRMLFVLSGCRPACFRFGRVAAPGQLGLLCELSEQWLVVLLAALPWWRAFPPSILRRGQEWRCFAFTPPPPYVFIAYHFLLQPPAILRESVWNSDWYKSHYMGFP